MIYSYENSLRADTCMEYLRGVDGVKWFDKIILLPIPSTKDKKMIMHTNVGINELKDQICGRTLISSYGLDSAWVQALADAGATLIELSEDEEFLLENAELTAVATLGILLTSSGISIADLRVGIVGYGRIGKRLVNHLLYHGASVKVFTSRADTRIELCTYGVASVRSCADADLSGLDLLINTAPAVIFSPSSIPAGLRIIDLASGENFPGVDGVERYPSVPAKMFPISAGKTWGRALERHIANIH